jgi:ABC-type hemin transport system substrate-binding protein
MNVQPSTSKLRVVSLLPSCTDIVQSLGLSSMLVGRSHEVRRRRATLHEPFAAHRMLRIRSPSRQVKP